MKLLGEIKLVPIENDFRHLTALWLGFIIKYKGDLKILFDLVYAYKTSILKYFSHLFDNKQVFFEKKNFTAKKHVKMTNNLFVNMLSRRRHTFGSVWPSIQYWSQGLYCKYNNLRFKSLEEITYSLKFEHYWNY